VCGPLSLPAPRLGLALRRVPFFSDGRLPDATGLPSVVSLTVSSSVRHSARSLSPWSKAPRAPGCPRFNMERDHRRSVASRLSVPLAVLAPGRDSFSSPRHPGQQLLILSPLAGWVLGEGVNAGHCSDPCAARSAAWGVVTFSYLQPFPFSSVGESGMSMRRRDKPLRRLQAQPTKSRGRRGKPHSHPLLGLPCPPGRTLSFAIVAIAPGSQTTHYLLL